MATFSEKCRKMLRRIFIILGVSAISLMFAACYGMPIDDGEQENENSTEEPAVEGDEKN